jgi:hypothetical protein
MFSPAAHVSYQLLLLAAAPKFGYESARSCNLSTTPCRSRAAVAKGEQPASHFKSTCTQFHATQVISPVTKEVNEAGGDTKRRTRRCAPLLAAAVRGGIA